MYIPSYGRYLIYLSNHFGSSASHLPDRYIPGYLKELQDGHVEELALFKRQLNDVRLTMVCSSWLECTFVELILDGGSSKERGEELPPSFGKYLLERQKELDLSDSETAYLAGSMFGAGSDTTASAISVAIMAAACYPEAQAKVQEELDNVIGKERGKCSKKNSCVLGCGSIIILWVFFYST